MTITKQLLQLNQRQKELIRWRLKAGPTANQEA